MPAAARASRGSRPGSSPRCEQLGMDASGRCGSVSAADERWGAVDDVAQMLNEQLGKTALMTGAQFALRHIDESQKQPKAKCPFTPQREMIAKLWGAEGPGKSVQGTLF